MVLCEMPQATQRSHFKRVWRSQVDGHKVLGWSKHYFLELPLSGLDANGFAATREVSGRSMTACTIRGAKLMEIV